MLCVKFAWNWPSGLRVFNVLSLCRYYLPLENKKLMVLEKTLNVIILFSLSSTFGKHCGPSYEQTWMPLAIWCFMLSLVKIGPLVLIKKLKMWKVYRQTDVRQHVIKKLQRFHLRLAKNPTESPLRKWENTCNLDETFVNWVVHRLHSPDQ